MPPVWLPDFIVGCVTCGESGDGLSDGDKGDITVSGSGSTLTIDNDVVTNAKSANMAQATVKGRASGAGTGDPTDLSATQVRTIINVEDGADVTDATNVDAAGAVMNADASTASMSFVIDEDSFATNSATKVPTQQSVKAYVDANAGAVSDGDKGDITVSASGATYTIDNDTVTYAKMQNIATDSLVGRDTAGTGDPESITLATSLEFSGSGTIRRSALTGDVTASAGSNATTIANDAVTYAKMQNVSATDKILGRTTAGSGDVEEVTFTDQAQQLCDDTSFGAMLTTLGAQPVDADLTTLSTAFASASASGPATLAFHEDTDNGTNKITISGVATVGSDKTLTLPDATDTLVGKATSDVFTNKTIDANGSGNSISNLEVADFTAASIVTEAEGLNSSDNDTSLPTTAAVKDYVDDEIAGVSAGDVSSVTFDINQTAHGFSVGNAIYHNGTDYDPADNDAAATAEFVGLVTAVADANNFTITTHGRVTGLSGLTAGEVYFVGDSGALTATAPTTPGEISKPVFIADSTTTGFVHNMRGSEVLSGYVDTANSPNANEFARFTDADTIEGRTASETRTDLGLVIGTNVQAYDADLTTLSTSFSSASASGPATLAFHEDTDNGTNKITVTTAASIASDVTLTLPSATDTLVGKATGDVFTNKTFDANGSGNSLSNVEIADFAGSAIVTAAEGLASSDNDTSVPTTAAVIDGIAAIPSLSDGDKGDITVASSGTSWTVDSGAISLAKMANIATDSLIGRDTAGTGVPEAITLATSLEFSGSGTIRRSALTGDVTASAGSNATTIANDAVTYAKMQNVSATDRLLGRDTAAAGDVEEITVSGGIEFTGSTGIQTSAFTGDVTKSAGGTATAIANDAVTYAKMQDVSATDRLLGRVTAGSGNVEEIVFTDFAQTLLDDTTATIARGTLGVNSFTKSITLETPVANDKIAIWRTPVAITITETIGVRVAGTNVVYQLRHNTDYSATGTDTWTANKTVTSATTGDSATSTASDVTVAAGEYIWLFIASVSGSVTQFHLDVHYTLD